MKKTIYIFTIYSIILTATLSAQSVRKIETTFIILWKTMQNPLSSRQKGKTGIHRKDSNRTSELCARRTKSEMERNFPGSVEVERL